MSSVATEDMSSVAAEDISPVATEDISSVAVSRHLNQVVIAPHGPKFGHNEAHHLQQAL